MNTPESNPSEDESFIPKEPPENSQQASSETIRLDQFLKFQQLAQSGGHAKLMIQSGMVLVNGAMETRRSRKLVVGDVVELDGQKIPVESDGEG